MIKILDSKKNNFSSSLNNLLLKRKNKIKFNSSIVINIIRDIRKNGDKALIKYEKKFGKSSIIFSRPKEIQKQINTMPGQEKMVMEYYQKNPSAATSLRGAIYESKIINLIKEKSKSTKKTISTKEADLLIETQHRTHEHFKEKESKTSEKTIKSIKKKKKIRKK